MSEDSGCHNPNHDWRCKGETEWCGNLRAAADRQDDVQTSEPPTRMDVVTYLNAAHRAVQAAMNQYPVGSVGAQRMQKHHSNLVYAAGSLVSDDLKEILE